MKISVAIHQPNYLPWIGYFYKMCLSDQFVFLDHVKINIRGFTRRTLITDLSSSDQCFLTVPVIALSDSKKIDELKIDHSNAWSTYHLSRLYQLYKKEKYYSDYSEAVSSWYTVAQQFEYLADWNIFLINKIGELLDIKTPTIKSSTLNLCSPKELMHIKIIKQLNGKRYISGVTGQVYRDDNVFTSNEIEVLDTDFLSYLNITNGTKALGFNPKLNILDALFKIGKDNILQHFKNYEPE